LLGLGLTSIGGLLPDLDSDAGIAVRELFGAAAAIVPLLLLPRLMHGSLSHEEVICATVALYLFIRYVAGWLFRRFTVHRGMFHSIPALLIAGLVVYLGYKSPEWRTRAFLGGGVMLGFLSHLVLDELYSVDLRGLTVRLNKYAGSALKFVSPSPIATAFAYLLLLLLCYWLLVDTQHQPHRPEWLEFNRTSTTG
jgi:membrane-bound metal-dependent hydrolase YbcI (DUF457 family)